jgi:hypothetical protein
MIKELIKLANRLDTKGLQEEADALDKIVKAAMPSTYHMTQLDKDEDILKKIAELVHKQAFELAGRDDEKYLEMEQGMKDEFLEDANFRVKNLINEFVKNIKEFDMAPSGSLEGETPSDEGGPIEAGKPTHRGNPNDPWDALFPTKE